MASSTSSSTSSISTDPPPYWVRTRSHQTVKSPPHPQDLLILLRQRWANRRAVLVLFSRGGNISLFYFLRVSNYFWILIRKEFPWKENWHFWLFINEALIVKLYVQHNSSPSTSLICYVPSPGPPSLPSSLRGYDRVSSDRGGIQRQNNDVETGGCHHIITNWYNVSLLLIGSSDCEGWGLLGGLTTNQSFYTSYKPDIIYISLYFLLETINIKNSTPLRTSV